MIEHMYKKTEKRINFLLDKLLLRVTSGESLLKISYTENELCEVLEANKELLPANIQEKIIEILAVLHSYSLLSIFQDKNYQHLSSEIAKLLDLGDPFFSSDVIETLYKMGTYQFVDEILLFSALSIDDKMPFTQDSYRAWAEICSKFPPGWFFQKYHRCNRTWEFYSKFPPNADSNFKWLNDVANKYIKRAEKLKAKHK